MLIFLVHLGLYAAAYFLSFLLRLDFRIYAYFHKPPFWIGLVLVLLARAAFGAHAGLYQRVLKYVGMPDLIDILRSMSMASVAFVVTAVLFGLREIPRSIFVLDWMVSIVLVGGLRFALRMVSEATENAAPSDEEGHQPRKRVAIIGAGDAGESLVRDLSLQHRERYEVVGFLDDDSAKKGLRIRDVKVLGPVMYLGDYISRYGIDQVLIAIPTLKGEDMRRIVSICKIAGVQPKTLPSMDQLIEGNATVSQLRDVAIEDLLGRDPIQLEERTLRHFLEGKCIMVSGAGGSIGSELCRQILRYAPRSLLLIERAEPSMFFIHRELIASHPDIPVLPIIADITDAPRMRKKVFEPHRPEVIFHAAAHKHVPMMEWNPAEAVRNNSFGTKQVADLAHEFAAQAFVMISTDKAVNPSSVMGASKRIAEMYVQALARNSQTKFTAVRFGNVLGSTGSVIPIFKEQIAKGGPVTVTHPDMRRYFMTIPEASQLVMQAGAMGQGGEIFVLDMGTPVKIVDLARDLITLSGLEPDKDIQITYTGLRPGEKLFEELCFDAEKMSKTRHPKIYTGKLSGVPLDEIENRLGYLYQAMETYAPDTVRCSIKWLVPEFTQKAEPFDLGSFTQTAAGRLSSLAQAFHLIQPPRGVPTVVDDLDRPTEPRPRPVEAEAFNLDAQLPLVELGAQDELPLEVTEQPAPDAPSPTTAGVPLHKGWFAPVDDSAPTLDWDSLWLLFRQMCRVA